MGAFDIAARCHRHDHVFARNQIFVVHVAGPIDNLCAARHGKEVFALLQLIRDDAHDPLTAAQNFKVFLDLTGQVFQFVRHFLDADLGQALQTQLQNGAGLNFGQVIGAVLIRGMGRIVDQGDIGQDVLRGPTAGHQLFTRLCRIGRGPDGSDDFVNIGDGHGQTTQDVTAVTGLAQQIGGAARHDFFTEIKKAGQEAAQRQGFGTATVQRQHVTAEIGLKRRKAEQLVHHHFGRGITFQFDHDAHTVAVGFVLHMGDAFNLFVARGLGDPFDHRGLVHLIGDLIDHNGPTVLADLFDTGLGPDHNAAAPFQIGFARTGPAQHDAARGEIGAGDIVDQLL